MGDAGISILANRLTGLRYLGLTDMGITDKGVRRLTEIRSLEKIWIEDPDELTTEKNMEYLLAMPRLKVLAIPIHWDVDAQTQQDFRRRNIKLKRSEAVGHYYDGPFK